MNYKNLAIFVILSCGLGWFLMNVLPNLIELEEMWQQIALVFAYLWSPGLVAYILHKRLNNGSLGDIGFLSGRLDVKWLGKSILAPLGLLAGTLGIVFVLGNLLGIPGFGYVSPGELPMPGSAALLISPAEPFLANFMSFPPFESMGNINIIELIPFMIMLMVMGVIFGQLLFLGEEIAWRGFLFNETKPLGFLGSSLITGLAWALWTLFPLITRGYLEPTDLLHTTGLLVAMSFLITYLGVKTGSVIATAAFRGVFTTMTVIGAVFISQADPLVGSMTGVAGMIAMLGAAFLIIRYDKDFVEKYKELSYKAL